MSCASLWPACRREAPGFVPALWTVLAILQTTSEAADLYVAPTGTPLGPGTTARAYDLATALSGNVGAPGDTFWLRGGDYRLGHVDTTIQGAPGQPIVFRQIPGERARIQGSLSVFDSEGYVIFRDFELYGTDTNRLSRQLATGFNPTDINPVGGVSSYAPNLSFINLIVHDHVRHGFYISESASNNLVYGCIVYNNGWVGPDNASGHNFYVQGNSGSKRLEHNLAFNNAGVNFQVYESAAGRSLVGITLEGNVAFHAGTLARVRADHDWIVGVDAPAERADGIVLKNNLGYYQPGTTTHPQVQLGRAGTNGALVLTGNYLPLELVLSNWTSAIVLDNLFAPTKTDYVVSLSQGPAPLKAWWDYNRYAGVVTEPGFLCNALPGTFSDWQRGTGFDRHSSSTVARLSGTEVFVQPNRFEAGRAHLVVYNWNRLDTVAVDVSSVLTWGMPYEVRNAQDLSAPPVLKGIYQGLPLQLPMTGLTVAVPNGPLPAPPPTGPTFNIFLLQPQQARLKIEARSGQIQLSWPTNADLLALQFQASAPADGNWVDVPDVPAVVGEHFVVTKATPLPQGYYRLRSGTQPNSSVIP